MRITSVLLLGTWLILSPIQARVHGYVNQSRVNVGNRSANVNQNFNRNTNVNRNVNVNNNVNVNRNVNVNVHGGYYGGGCCAYHDDWGSFAAGAVVGAATTAVVAAATSSHNATTVVTVPVPAVGTVLGALPGGCTVISAPGTAIYNCNNIYYRPYYQGSTLVYQVVTYP